MIRVRILLPDGALVNRAIEGIDPDDEVYEIAMELTGQPAIEWETISDEPRNPADAWPGRHNKVDKDEGRAVLQKIDQRITHTEATLEDLQTERREIINFYGLNK